MTALPDLAISPSKTPTRVRLPHRPGSRTDLDLLLEEITPGHAVFSAHVSPTLDLTASTGSERLCATLLDLTLAAAVQSTLGPGVTYSVLELRVRQVPGDLPLLKRVHCVADTVTHGRVVTTAGGRVLDAAGRVRAYGWLVARMNAD